METKKKSCYLPPVLGIMLVEMEEGIATGSSTLSGGADNNNPNNPGVDGWGAEELGGSSSADL